MNAIFARKALIHKGWATEVRLELDAGRIAALTENAVPEATDVEVGVLIPGLCNAHSHAFQRALAGRTEKRSPEGRDNFWTWRSRMYALSAKIDAAALEAIARQVYGEMVATGYTSVAEFHYLHNEPGTSQTSEAMFEAIARAGGTDKAKVRDEIEKTKGFIGTGGESNMSASDHLGLDLDAFKMLEIKNGDWTLVE